MREENSSQKKKNAITSNKWFLPAVYMVCVALLMIGAFWYQGVQDNEASPKESQDSAESIHDRNHPSIEVNENVENFKLPLTDSDNVLIKKEFYDVNGTENQQEAALVKYGNTYQPSTGIDYAMKDDSTFDVTATMSGKVTRVQKDSLLGNLVEIEHDTGIVTQYSSITDISVKEGDKVMQGAIIAKSGKSEINVDAGVHVHFEMRKDNVAVNPLEYMEKPLSILKALDTTKETASQQESSTTDDNAANSTEKETTDNGSSDSTDDQSTQNNQSQPSDDSSTGSDTEE